MDIYALDPGHNETGVAFLSSWRNEFYAKQFIGPLDAWAALEHHWKHRRTNGMATLIIEDYRTAGHVTKEAKTTIGLVAFYKLAAEHYWYEHINVIVRVEQARLSGQREAAELMGGTIEALKNDPKRKDAFSALSHCVTYRRTI